MDAKRTLSISEARKRIFDIAEDVQVPHRVYTLTADGKPKIVIMSSDEYESWLETMEVMRIFPDLNEVVAETDAAIKSGEYKKWPTLDDLRKDWGIASAVADKPKKKYAVRTSRKAASSKKHK